MATVSISVDIKPALENTTREIDLFLFRADRKFKVAGARMEAYAKAAAPVDTGFHRRNIRHNANAPFMTAELVAAAEYASVLEFGFAGTVNVKAHTRTRGDNTHRVRAHTREMVRFSQQHLRPAGKRALEQLIKDLQSL